MKYAVVSDIHCHSHSIFAGAPVNGVNGRLAITLSELERAAQELVNQGGNVMIVAGDIFHTRGVMDPEVLNPTRATFDRIVSMGIDVFAIPGNHDLKSRDTVELSSAIQNLEQVGIAGGSFRVVNKADVKRVAGEWIGFVPWRYTKEELMADLKLVAENTGPFLADTDVFIHAGIDDVITGAPSSGLTAAELSKFGFRNIFAGHYHNHKNLGNGIVSIGATTHHNWGDIGMRAGFLIVDSKDGSFEFHDNLAPKFVDISGMDEDEMSLSCAGNYVRFRGPQMTNDQVEEFRKELKGWGALGISIEVPRVTSATRTTTPAKGVSVKDSIINFVDGSTLPAHINKDEVKRRAVEIFDLSQSVIEEA